MVRSYRKYEPTQTFGTICTATSNTLWTPTASPAQTTSRSTSSGLAYTPANQAILCWDIKTTTLLSKLSDSSNTTQATVTSLALCAAQPDILAAGYSDGSIRVWDALSGQVIVRFDGHRAAITCLLFDRGGERLVSGGRDTDVIVWDLVTERAEGRLRGHKGEITGLAFLGGSDVDTGEKYVLTASKDALVKVWDLEGRYCVETHVAQSNGECWALALSPDGDGAITAGSDGELKAWSVDVDALGQNLVANGELSENGDTTKRSILKSRGVLLRQGNKDRTTGISFHPRREYIAIHGSDKAVEIWRLRTGDELHKHMQRKRRRRREKEAAASAANDTLPSDKSEDLDSPDVSDVFVPHLIVRTGGKVRSVAWMTNKTPSNISHKSLQLLVAGTNNLLETYDISTQTANPRSTKQSGTEGIADYTRALSLDLPGHRTDIRTLALSSDDRMLASASAGQLKVWNLRTQSCLRTLECGQALCSAFLPGDRIVLLGTKEGQLEVYDISTSTLLESIPAHGDGEGEAAKGKAIWSIAVHPDGKSVVTGGADKTARFWRFDIVEEEIPGTRRTTPRLRLTQTRQMKLADDVVALTFTPDARYLALSTLDNTVKIFFTDSLKLFLTLYGHKLPVLDMSVSSDGKLIATCSADKYIRIWGLDFGDCHKALLAHTDSVMAVSFIAHPVEADEKYLLFSAGKDGVVKTWDAGKFQQVQRLEGHKGEIWAMTLSRTGEMCVSAAHDRSLRVWSVGDDVVFLEEERERELEELYEGTLARNLDRDWRDEEQADTDGDGGGEGEGEVVNAGKQTIATLTHGEKILEALEACTVDHELMQAYARDKLTNPKLAPPQRNPLFLAQNNISAELYLLQTLRRIPSPALNDALLTLPFTSLQPLLRFLSLFMQQRLQPELAWRIVYFLLQVHMKQILSAPKGMREVLEEVLEGYEKWVEDERGVLGFNFAGLEILGRDVVAGEMGGWVGDMDDRAEEERLEKGRRKRGFASLA